ncbi:hypothetical protein KDD30_10635 [Photobacterium sp. GJ3]|uniref:hypothetical protein n=1 Tax=Photobacterium sp. GJ3 TaxID=2829502 RepID=UPI001B8D8DEA|nr:hypothetical protein [Photobacterium sp. GJ3]QUJ66617.1 hypothetical protein KDD30_10635 [Photobacterium sp. GJ3]
MKKVLPVLLVSFLAMSGSAFADKNEGKTEMMENGLEVNVTPRMDGAWVLVEKEGVPQANVTVVDTKGDNRYMTNDKGRVFVYSSKPYSHTLNLKVSEIGGEPVEVKSLIPSDK